MCHCNCRMFVLLFMMMMMMTTTVMVVVVVVVVGNNSINFYFIFRWILRVLRVIKSLFKVGNVNNDENMKRYLSWWWWSQDLVCNDLYIFLYLAPWGPETVFVFSVFLWGLEIFPAFLSSKHAQSKGVKLSLEVYFKVDCFLQISVISSLQSPVGAFVHSVMGMVY